MNLKRLTKKDGLTVVDSVTSLTWKADLLNGTFTWEEACNNFGKARYIQEENAPREISTATYRKYQFRSAENDWRLPTVEELRSLADMYRGEYHDLLKEVFGASHKESLWSANDAGAVRSSDTYHGAWCLFDGHGICEMPVTEKYSVRPVRSGSVFNSMEWKPKGILNSLIEKLF